MDLANAEISYGAGLAGQLKWYELDGTGHIKQTREQLDNKEQITGHPYSEQGAVIDVRYATSGTLPYRGILDTLIFWHMALLGGPATSGAGDPYTHEGKYPGLGVDGPPSTSIVQGTDRTATASYKEFPGIVPISIKVSIEKGGFLTYAVEVNGNGDMTDASGETPPTIGQALRADQLVWEDIAHCKLGPAAEDITSLFRKLEYTLKANLVRRETPGSGRLAAAWDYDQKKGIELELSLTLKGERGDTMWGYWNAGTALLFDFLIQKSASRSFQIQGNKCEIPGEELDDTTFDEAGNSLLVFPLKFHYNAADLSPFIFTGLNGLSQILG